MSFAQNLQAIMNEKNLNQTDLLKLTGIGKSSLSQYLSGKNVPHNRRIEKIAKALEISPQRLTVTFQTKNYEHSEELSNQKVPIEEAARRLGKSQQFIRLALQNGVAPFGFATRGTGSTYDYHISPKLLNEYIGKIV
jgi:transcriptional regulator with XRE-family HTH domain